MRRIRPVVLLGHLGVAAVLAAAYEYFVGGGARIRFTLLGEQIELSEPRWLALAILLPYLSLVAFHSLADLPRLQRALSVALRALVLTGLALALSQPVITSVRRQVCTVLLVDVSDSITESAIERAAGFVRRAHAARAGNLMRLVTFARRPRRLRISEQGQVPPIARHGAPPAQSDASPPAEGAAAPERPLDSPGSATDIQAALQLAYGLFPPGTIRRVVVLSDGNETAGDLLAEATRAAQLSTRISFRTFPELRPREALVSRVVLPEPIRVGEPFDVTVHVWASHRMRARVTLYQGRVINGLDGIRDVTLEPGETRLAYRSIVHVPGALVYRADVSNLETDRFADNNSYTVAADVTGRPTICYVEGEPASARYLQNALSGAGFDVEVRSGRAFPASLPEMERFDAIVLSDVPAQEISLSQMRDLERYVRDVGGGFIMTGGQNSFGMGGYYGTTIERILPVRFDTDRRREQPTLALVLVIDKSGSMSGAPIELAKEAARATAEILAPDDLIEVVAFDSRPTTVVRMTPARNRSKIANDIARLTAGGGTAIFPALDVAYRDLTTARARTKHVILLSDGQSPTQGISELVTTMAAEGITVSTVGLGPQTDRALLQSIADQAGGRFHHTNDPYNIPRIFTRETSQVSRSSVVEEFIQAVPVGRSEFLRGVPITTAPYLRGYVATRMKPLPAELIIASDLGEPLLARMRVGLGQTVAWTSDVKNRWASDWLRWPGYATFWSQLLREAMRQRRAGVEHPMTAEVVGGDVRVTVDAHALDDSFVNGLSSSLEVVDPADPDHPTRMPLRQTAPGWYEARFPMGRAGTFILRAEHRDSDGRLVANSHTTVASPYPAEYLTVEADSSRLTRAAALTGGTAEIEPTAVFDAGEDEGTEYQKPLWPYVVSAIVFLLLVDLLLRRVRLFDRDFKARA